MAGGLPAYLPVQVNVVRHLSANLELGGSDRFHAFLLTVGTTIQAYSKGPPEERLGSRSCAGGRDSTYCAAIRDLSNC